MARRTGVSLAEATLVVSAVVLGMIVGRMAISTHALGVRDPVWMIRSGIALALAGLLVPWVSTSYELSMAGMVSS